MNNLVGNHAYILKVMWELITITNEFACAPGPLAFPFASMRKRFIPYVCPPQLILSHTWSFTLADTGADALLIRSCLDAEVYSKPSAR